MIYHLPNTNPIPMVCFHGFGGDFRIADALMQQHATDRTLISFNFPDHNLQDDVFDATNSSFGTPKELEPAIEVLQSICKKKLPALDLYGFSAGGGALINTLALLQSIEHPNILLALQKGRVILDCPLKSIEELIDFRGSNPALEILRGRYEQNQMRPIDALSHLEGLSLNIIVHFQIPDEVLSNRDDRLFIERLERYNASGKTTVIYGSDGGHNAFHHSLWKSL